MVQAMYLSMGLQHDYRKALKNVSAPVLVIHGADDLQTEDASRTYTESFANSRLHVMQNATHFSFYEQPEGFSMVLGEFLGGLE